MGAIAALPLEFLLLRLLDTVPIDIEPAVPQNLLVQLGGFIAAILHCPAFLLWGGGFNLPRTVWFLIGYTDLLILWFLAIVLRRVWKNRSKL